jgi:replicative DNA helicase
MLAPPATGNVLQFKALDGRPLTVPFNLEAEQALLGAILMNNEALYRAGDFIQPGHFYEPTHQQIFEVISKIIKSGKAATPITAKTWLPEKVTEDMTMQQYLGRLATDATTIINAADFAHTIVDAAQRRELIGLSSEVAHAAYYSDVDMPAPLQIEAAEKRLYELAERGGVSQGFAPFSSALTAAILMVGEAYRRDGGLSGVATGLTDLDRMMGGLQKSDLIIIAGRPAMGKTALATNIAYNVADAYRGQVEADGRTKAVNGGRVGFFSLEMSAEQLATRILAERAGISSSNLRRGNIHESQFSQLVDVANRLSEIPLYIDDTGGLNIAQLAARARRLKRQKGLDLIVVDYLQLLSAGNGNWQQNRVTELTLITTALKALAKDLETPIIALSQLSRQVESREDKHPQLSDLRESGSIEQDADVVLFVYREEYYLKNREPKEGTSEHLAWQGEMEKFHGRAEVIIGKQRHGPTGTVPLSFEAQFTRFGNLANESYVPERFQ